MKPSGGTFFSLQVSAEAEGSGLGWGSDVGSGSGDLVRTEELLRVSVRMTLPGAWDCPLDNQEDYTFPPHLYMFGIFHFSQFCFK